jgi:hypothetical protein
MRHPHDTIFLFGRGGVANEGNRLFDELIAA